MFLYHFVIARYLNVSSVAVLQIVLARQVTQQNLYVIKFNYTVITYGYYNLQRWACFKCIVPLSRAFADHVTILFII